MYILKEKFNLRIIFLLIVFFSFLSCNFCKAAILYLEPSGGKLYQGDTFIVDLRIDSEDECINSIKGDLFFSQEVLEAVDFSQGNSTISIWLEQPIIDQKLGTISFTGGIPGGYCGQMPGDPVDNNLLGKVVIRVMNQRLSIASIGFLNTSQVYLNDGMGTLAKTKVKTAFFDVLKGFPDKSKDEWEQVKRDDTIQPEPFEIEIQKDPSIFKGKYFIIFSTTDKQTGIDHYEIREGLRIWKKVSSPYLLEDQGLSSIITVKAIDKAGNERIAQLPASRKGIPPELIYLILLIGGILTIGLVLRFLIKKRIKEEINKQ